MNRYTWYETHDWKVPYPGDSKIYAPARSRARSSRAPTRTDSSLTRDGPPDPAGRRVIWTKCLRRLQCARGGSASPSARSSPSTASTSTSRRARSTAWSDRTGPGRRRCSGLLLGLAKADGGDLEILGSPVRRTLALPDGVAGFVDGPGSVSLAHRAAEPRRAGAPAGRRRRRHRRRAGAGRAHRCRRRPRPRLLARDAPAARAGRRAADPAAAAGARRTGERPRSRSAPGTCTAC